MCSCPLLSSPTGLKQLPVVAYPSVFKANCFQKYSHLCLDIEPGQIKLSPGTYEYWLHTSLPLWKTWYCVWVFWASSACHMQRPLDLESSAPMGFLPSWMTW